MWYSRAGISTHVNVGSNTAPASFRFAHNLWYAHDQPNRSQPSLPVAEKNAITGHDPQFIGLTERDYRLTPSSPAAAKGKEIRVAKADQLERCYVEPPSIGAFEANPAQLPAPR